MKFGIENNVISSYKRLSYEAWYAFAEFVDNSTQAYFDNKKVLDMVYQATGKKLEIYITYNRDADFIEIKDNSIGMDEIGLDKALKVGLPPDNPTQRSKYGLGMKTAACWFGNNWTIRTKKLNEAKGYEVNIDVDSISKQEGEVEIIPIEFDADLNEHFTIITIKDLNRKFIGRTITKIKEYLGSIYRFDLEEGIEIYWNGAKLFYKRFEDELYVNEKGEISKEKFEFDINERVVKGWVGVLGKGYGSRKKAGFSIIQNKRVIQGWPNGYKPSSIFGEQEDGSNDLVNQRVVGELFLDGFSVSHTKDKIVWEDDEEEQLDKKLGEICSDARSLALTLRFYQDEQKDKLKNYKEEAIAIFLNELKSIELKDFLHNVQPLPEEIIKTSYENMALSIQNEANPLFETQIAESINLVVYFNEVSDLEPYILYVPYYRKDSFTIIINNLHPVIQELQSTDSLVDFFRNYIYDGVAEWKSFKLTDSIQPFTVKFIKDGLLRIPSEIKNNKIV